MAVVRVALGTCLLIAMQGCAEPEPELHMESPDPIASSASALEVAELNDEITALAPISLCAELSGTYDYAPWAREFNGSARCVKQTTTVPAMGFGTDHKTSASFPEFTGVNIALSGQDTPATKCKKAGIRVKIRWLADGTTWNYEVKAVPKYAPITSIYSLPRVTECVATHTSGLSGHGPSDFTITTTPFTGLPVVFPTIPSFRPMTSRVEAIF